MKKQVPYYAVGMAVGLCFMAITLHLTPLVTAQARTWVCPDVRALHDAFHNETQFRLWVEWAQSDSGLSAEQGDSMWASIFPEPEDAERVQALTRARRIAEAAHEADIVRVIDARIDVLAAAVAELREIEAVPK